MSDLKALAARLRKVGFDLASGVSVPRGQVLELVNELNEAAEEIAATKLPPEGVKLPERYVAIAASEDPQPEAVKKAKPPRKPKPVKYEHPEPVKAETAAASKKRRAA